MKLNEFHKANIARQHEAFAPPHPLMALVACMSKKRDILEDMKAARDRAKRRLDIADLEVTMARRDVDDWDQRIARAERERKRRTTTSPTQKDG